jgi:Tat protein translocase TatB subunit
MNISFSEIVVVLLVALLLFGPEQLPSIARQLGKLAADLRKGTNAVRREFYNSVYQPAQEVRRDLQAHGQHLRSLRAEVLAPPTPPASQEQSKDTPNTPRTEFASGTPEGDSL